MFELYNGIIVRAKLRQDMTVKELGKLVQSIRDIPKDFIGENLSVHIDECDPVKEVKEALNIKEGELCLKISTIGCKEEWNNETAEKLTKKISEMVGGHAAGYLCRQGIEIK